MCVLQTESGIPGWGRIALNGARRGVPS
jgi:hypothetical protein